MNLNDQLNEDNTLLNSIDFEESSFLKDSFSNNTKKRQKFSVLSLKKPQTQINPSTSSKRTNMNENTDINTTTKKFKATEFTLPDDSFEDFDLTQVLLKNAEKSRTLETRSASDSVLEVPNKTEFDAFKSHLDELSHFIVNTQMMNEIETVIQENEPFKHPTEKRSLDKLQDVFHDKTPQEIQQFFNRVEHSIMGVESSSHNEKLLEALLNSQKVDNSDLPSSQTMANIDWNDQSLANISTYSFNSSFGTTMRKVFLENAIKNRVSSSTDILSISTIPNKPQFTTMGPFYDLPIKVKDLIKLYKGIDHLYDWQDECLNLPAIKQRKNLIYALPTSGGKTLVAEILMLREMLCCKRNALFILPFVAIVQEKVWALSPFAVALDFLVEEYAASKGVYPPRKRRRKNSVYIATIEKALGLLNSLIETGRTNEIGLIVVDELHLVGEQGRGSTLEALLTKILLIKADIQIIGMSATIGNVNDICRFLNADIYTQNFRPVELTEYVKCGDEIAKINWSKKEEELLSVHRKVTFGYTEALNNIDPDKIGGLVMEVIPNDSCLVFCPSKKNCENVAYLLCKVANKKLLEYKKEEKKQIKQALRDESGSLCKVFNVSIQYGIAYHHSGLTNEERGIIETSFRSGILSVICCTSTLAAGVNLPAKRVILRQPYIGKDFLNLSRYKQMVGRAGRAGFGEMGESIMVCTLQDLPKVKQLLMSPMDQALSSMHESEGKGLRHLLLSCINLGIANTRAELQQVSKHTLLYIQKEQLEVDVKKLTDRIIGDLFKLGALQEADLSKPEHNLSNVSIRLETSLTNQSTSEGIESQQPVPKKRKIVVKSDTKLVISKLGCAAIKGGFELSRAHMLYDDLHQAQKSLVLLDCLHLLYLITPYEVAEHIRPNKNEYYNIYCKLKPNELQTARVLGLTESVALKMISNKQIKNISERVLNRFYLTLILYDLWNEKPVFQVSEKFQINRGVVQNLMTSSATFASNVVNFCEGLEEFWTFAHLLKGMSQRLSHCCVKELLPLMELPAVKQSRAKQLYNAGYKSLQSIAKADATALVDQIEFLPRVVANQLIAAAKMLLLEKVENLREEAEDVLEGVEISKFVTSN